MSVRGEDRSTVLLAGYKAADSCRGHATPLQNRHPKWPVSVPSTISRVVHRNADNDLRSVLYKEGRIELAACRLNLNLHICHHNSQKASCLSKLLL